jgi:hypothetical protein
LSPTHIQPGAAVLHQHGDPSSWQSRWSFQSPIKEWSRYFSANG